VEELGIQAGRDDLEPLMRERLVGTGCPPYGMNKRLVDTVPPVLHEQT
jgi:hypothetical protein